MIVSVIKFDQNLHRNLTKHLTKKLTFSARLLQKAVFLDNFFQNLVFLKPLILSPHFFRPNPQPSRWFQGLWTSWPVKIGQGQAGQDPDPSGRGVPEHPPARPWRYVVRFYDDIGSFRVDRGRSTCDRFFLGPQNDPKWSKLAGDGRGIY